VLNRNTARGIWRLCTFAVRSSLKIIRLPRGFMDR
jgi:hypothetical protein